MIVIGAAALLFFGPDQLPKVARKVGTVVRDVQLTSQSFIREMERAADESELRESVRAPVEHYADPSPAHGFPEPGYGEIHDETPHLEVAHADAPHVETPREEAPRAQHPQAETPP